MTDPAAPQPVPQAPGQQPPVPSAAPPGAGAPVTAPLTAPGATAAGAGPAPGASAASAAPAVVPEQLPPGHQATGPLPGRPPAPPAGPSAGPRRRTVPRVRMGPWAPVAGGALGLVAGVVAVLLLAGRADGYAEALSLTLLVVGLTLLGAAGVLLADEVRVVRRGTSDAGVRPQWVEATAGLVNGLTPARLLLGTSAFVLFLSAYAAT
ncbi:hypothetical protein [Geodermatophilus sp. FMUSA9-8]|uniref:hypothetical protein n=1 Tax=Geodermatophilus sp. FMUSA9-8 TaxID=3120155 RepID=UPI00300B7C42